MTYSEILFTVAVTLAVIVVAAAVVPALQSRVRRKRVRDEMHTLEADLKIGNLEDAPERLSKTMEQLPVARLVDDHEWRRDTERVLDTFIDRFRRPPPPDKGTNAPQPRSGEPANA